MKPYNSSSDKENCSPISSNCVIWQGPDLSCINLCKGDSVSDVVYKLATELCAIKESTDLTDLELNCLLDLCDNTPNPQLTIAAILQVIIDGLCCSVDSLTQTTNGLTDKTNNLYSEPELILPECLQYIDPATGLPVTTLVLSEYAVLTAQSLCDLRATVNIQTNQITSIDNRVTVLENEPGYVLPLVTPTCTYGTVISGVPAEMNVVVTNLDVAVCQLSSSIGSTTNILNAASQQCALLGSQTALSQSGTMSSLTGWNNTINNLAQSMQNLWLTVCDMRAAIYDVRQCCGQADCSLFFLGYSSGVNTARTEVTLFFNVLTTIPAGFTNCPVLSTVTITDGDGNTYSDIFDLVALSTDPAGLTIDVSAAFLNPLFPYTVTITGCIVKDGVTCSKIVTQTLAAPTTTTSTTTTTTAAPCTCYQWIGTADAADIADATGNTTTSRNGKVFVQYSECGTTNSTYIIYSIGGETSPFCSCLIPNAYYYKNDIQILASSGTVLLDSLC
jgi:hypothetical protein